MFFVWIVFYELRFNKDLYIFLFVFASCAHHVFGAAAALEGDAGHTPSWSMAHFGRLTLGSAPEEERALRQAEANAALEMYQSLDRCGAVMTTRGTAAQRVPKGWLEWEDPYVHGVWRGL